VSLGVEQLKALIAKVERDGETRPLQLQDLKAELEEKTDQARFVRNAYARRNP
jgi:hypothetical protein